MLENTNKFKPILYISTNDDIVKNKLIDKYTNTITQQKIEYERDQKEAILNSVIDFLVLSDCRFILGTHYSSFSDEACFMNLICKYCMSSHLSSLALTRLPLPFCSWQWPFLLLLKVLIKQHLRKIT